MNHFKYYLLFLLLVGCSYPAKDYDDYNCKNWQEEAYLDIISGEMLLIKYGMPEEIDSYIEIVYEKYNIGTKASYGCVINSPVECYNDIMYDHIIRRLGDSIFYKIEMEARALFEKELGYPAYGPITPYLVFDSCAKYSPDSLYNLSLRDYSHGMENAGFASEAGKDMFFQNYAFVYEDSIFSINGKYDSLIADLNYNFELVNEMFRCLADGGTHYGHMKKRVEAYSYFYYWNYILNCEIKGNVKMKEIEKKFILCAQSNPEVWSEKLYSPCSGFLDLELGDNRISNAIVWFMKFYCNE